MFSDKRYITFFTAKVSEQDYLSRSEANISAVQKLKCGSVKIVFQFLYQFRIFRQILGISSKSRLEQNVFSTKWNGKHNSVIIVCNK